MRIDDKNGFILLLVIENNRETRSEKEENKKEKKSWGIFARTIFAFIFMGRFGCGVFSFIYFINIRFNEIFLLAFNLKCHAVPCPRTKDPNIRPHIPIRMTGCEERVNL